MNPFVKQVNCLVIVVEETTSLLARFGARMKQQDYTQIDLGFAAAHFCLQATELGLGTCVLGWFDEARIQRYLGLSEGKRIRLVLAVGHPKEKMTRTTSRKTMDQIREYR
jgi:nitroreductase